IEHQDLLVAECGDRTRQKLQSVLRTVDEHDCTGTHCQALPGRHVTSLRCSARPRQLSYLMRQSACAIVPLCTAITTVGRLLDKSRRFADGCPRCSSPQSRGAPDNRNRATRRPEGG